MHSRPTWLLSLHEDFPSSAQLCELLPQHILLEPRDVISGRWPTVEGPLVRYGAPIPRRLTNLFRPGLSASPKSSSSPVESDAR